MLKLDVLHWRLSEPFFFLLWPYPSVRRRILVHTTDAFCIYGLGHFDFLLQRLAST